MKLSFNSFKNRNVVIFCNISALDHSDGMIKALQNFYTGVYLGSDKDNVYLSKSKDGKVDVAVKKLNIVTIQDYEIFKSEVDLLGPIPTSSEFN
jgi:hypothetical protein